MFRFAALFSEPSRRGGAEPWPDVAARSWLPELGRADDAMNDAVAACYGFPAGVWKDEKETLRLLLQLNQRIASPMSHAT